MRIYLSHDVISHLSKTQSISHLVMLPPHSNLNISHVHWRRSSFPMFSQSEIWGESSNTFALISMIPIYLQCFFLFSSSTWSSFPSRTGMDRQKDGRKDRTTFCFLFWGSEGSRGGFRRDTDGGVGNTTIQTQFERYTLFPRERASVISTCSPSMLACPL